MIKQKKQEKLCGSTDDVRFIYVYENMMETVVNNNI